ncbi:hypothetical protein K7432_012856 [Basidiobolus ranarum]|uniref:Uncharacterized protein n=1 Tax=Basidiobolus ranarum TaxID=34480 RepID=A0ABR2WK65_9FUNG
MPSKCTVYGESSCEQPIGRLTPDVGLNDSMLCELCDVPIVSNNSIIDEDNPQSTCNCEHCSSELEINLILSYNGDRYNSNLGDKMHSHTQSLGSFLPRYGSVSGLENGFPHGYETRNWNIGPNHRFLHKRGGGLWGMGPDDRFPLRGARPWNEEFNNGFPPRHGGGLWNIGSDIGFPFRSGNWHWGMEPDDRFLPRFARHCGGELNHKFTPRQGKKRWSFGPDIGFPPRYGGHHWSMESENIFPPKHARHWGGELDDRFSPRHGGQVGGIAPDDRFLPKYENHWDSEGEDIYLPRHGGRYPFRGPKDKYSPKNGRHRISKSNRYKEKSLSRRGGKHLDDQQENRNPLGYERRGGDFQSASKLQPRHNESSRDVSCEENSLSGSEEDQAHGHFTEKTDSISSDCRSNSGSKSEPPEDFDDNNENETAKK